MFTSWTSTNSALQQRVSETTTANENLHSHLAKTNQEIADQEKEISRLTNAIRAKEAPLKVGYNKTGFNPIFFVCKYTKNTTKI